jgi:hypothetical protein
VFTAGGVFVFVFFFIIIAPTAAPTHPTRPLPSPRPFANAFWALPLSKEFLSTD